VTGDRQRVAHGILENLARHAGPWRKPQTPLAPMPSFPPARSAVQHKRDHHHRKENAQWTAAPPATAAALSARGNITFFQRQNWAPRTGCFQHRTAILDDEHRGHQSGPGIIPGQPSCRHSARDASRIKPAPYRTGGTRTPRLDPACNHSCFTHCVLSVPAVLSSSAVRWSPPIRHARHAQPVPWPISSTYQANRSRWPSRLA